MCMNESLWMQRSSGVVTKTVQYLPASCTATLHNNIVTLRQDSHFSVFISQCENTEPHIPNIDPKRQILPSNGHMTSIQSSSYYSSCQRCIEYQQVFAWKGRASAVGTVELRFKLWLPQGPSSLSTVLYSLDVAKALLVLLALDTPTNGGQLVWRHNQNPSTVHFFFPNGSTAPLTYSLQLQNTQFSVMVLEGLTAWSFSQQLKLSVSRACTFLTLATHYLTSLYLVDCVHCDKSCWGAKHWQISKCSVWVFVSLANLLYAILFRGVQAEMKI